MERKKTKTFLQYIFSVVLHEFEKGTSRTEKLQTVSVCVRVCLCVSVCVRVSVIVKEEQMSLVPASLLSSAL